MTKKQMFRKAALAIREHGVSRGLYFGNDGEMCSLGALHFAKTRSRNSTTIYETIDRLCEISESSIISFNDDLENSCEDIASLLYGLGEECR